MDGDTRPRSRPQDMAGYTVHLDYGAPPEIRNDARPADRTHDHEPHSEAEASAEEQQKQPVPRWRKLLYWSTGIIVLLALAIGGIWYWLHSRHYESTDDAFIDAYMSQVSAQVAGRVIRLAIDDNQAVAQNQVLLELDPRDFHVRLDQAKAQRAQAAAQLVQAQAQMLTQQAAVDQAQANVRASEADLWQAQADLARYRSIDPKAITRQLLDTATASSRSAQAKLDANRQAVEAARANVEVQKAAITAAQANVAAADVAVANAELQLSYTLVEAPRAGTIAKRTVELGNYVNPGQALLAVVGRERWVTANFKETQLAEMKPGQPVRLKVDACPDHELEGRVDSFQPGSGSVFSALPPENATGNYVKVVQRVPVKITIEHLDAVRCQLSPGMSVEPRVSVR